MSRLEQITRAGYQVKFKWECEFDDAGGPELPAHPIVQQSPLRNRDAFYGVELRPCVYTIRHGRKKL